MRSRASAAVAAATGLTGALMWWSSSSERRHVVAHTQGGEEQPLPAYTAPRMKVRKASTRLSPIDNIVVVYEQRLRETGSLEKVFRYFSSLVVSGREMMTPMDLVRAITPGVPPSPMNKPINIPVFETPPEYVRKILTEEECPEFFKFNSLEDLGLISYGRFLILLALLSIPSEQLPVVYHMSCGEHFRNNELRGNGLGAKNLDYILEKHLKTRSQGYSNASHSKTSFHRHVFGDDLKRELTFDEFKTLHTNLLREVLKLEYTVLSDIVDGGGMSLIGFSRSIVARVPTEYRDIILQRATALEQEIKQQSQNEPVVTLEQYAAWKEVLKQLENMERAIRLYSHLDGHFSPSNLQRSAKAVAGVELTQDQVWVLFKLFDLNDDDVLAHEEFVRMLSNSQGMILQLQGTQGLALGHLGECCWNCVTSWYDGTYKDNTNQEEVN